MYVLFWLVYIVIVVYGNVLFENRQRKYVDSKFTRNASGVLKSELENSKVTSLLQGIITDKVLENILKVKKERVTDLKKNEFHGGDINKTRSSRRQSKLSIDLNDDVEMDETIYSTFDEKARHDGFKRSYPEDNPYAVMILTQIDAYEAIQTYECSGSLLTSRWVLTAAHCINFSNMQVFVIAGGSNLLEVKSSNRPRTVQVIESHTYYKHPSYDARDRTVYDVAVVKVDAPFKMTRTVGTIKLATKSSWSHGNYKACMFTGFGTVHLYSKDPDDHTRKTHYFEVKSSCPCLTKAGFDEVMCSRPRDDYGICSGDSGGGLVCNGKVVAVASFMIKFEDYDRCEYEKPTDCGLKETLSAFQKVEPYFGWINSTVNSANRSYDLFVFVIMFLLAAVYRNFL